jgi:hypothetical protein
VGLSVIFVNQVNLSDYASVRTNHYGIPLKKSIDTFVFTGIMDHLLALIHGMDALRAGRPLMLFLRLSRRFPFESRFFLQTGMKVVLNTAETEAYVFS